MIDYARIRRMAAAGITQGEIARALGCNKSTVSSTLARERADDPDATPRDPDFVSDAETLRRLTALVRRLEAEDRAAGRPG